MQTWTRGRPSLSSPDGPSNSSPLPERRRLELLPRSKPHAISESSEASEATPPTMEDMTVIEKEDEDEVEEEPTTLVPRSELIQATITSENTVVLMAGPPPGLEDIVPTPPIGIEQPTGNNKKKKNKKK